MALDTYTNLKAEVADWLNRQDLTSQIPTFVRLLEAQAERALRTREMITTASLTVTAGAATLPTDFCGMQDLYISTNSGPKALEYASIGELLRARHERLDTTGEPRLFTVQGASVLLAPIPNATYTTTLVYYKKIPKLTTTTMETNWLLDRHPDLYLYGTLMQAAPYLHGDERVPLWSSALTAILDQIRVADERETKGSTPLRARFKPYGGTR